MNADTLTRLRKISETGTHPREQRHSRSRLESGTENANGNENMNDARTVNSVRFSTDDLVE